MSGTPLFRTGRRRIGADDRILPLINVVFLLLIFFMLAGRLSASDPFPVEPPVSASPEADRPGGIALLIGADGRLALDGRFVALADLPEALADRAGKEPVRVKADGGTEAVRVVRVLSVLRKAGIDRLDLVTQAGGR